MSTRPLRTRDAAARLGITAQALRRAAAAGRVIGAHRTPNGWRFDPATLELTGRHGRRAMPSAAAIHIITARRRAA